ncbi:MAG TPA: DUF1080 domain-containing protein [Vineibacter sp.]|nr:DUF1080 domain-containing protein [Vineibacter sp.]
MIAPAATFRELLTADLAGWRMAGQGGFRWTTPGILASHGGPGLLWYADDVFDDFTLHVVWRTTARTDNSGIFLRSPALRDTPAPAIAHGYEVQIDDRGLDPQTGREGSPLHITGAIYRLAPCAQLLSRPTGDWNEFVIMARGPWIRVALNGSPAAQLDAGTRNRAGHLALQCHHEGSVVQFKSVAISRLMHAASGP